MQSKKIQQVFFSSLVVLSILSSLYLNLHVEPNQSALMELTQSETESTVKLMADIDVFQRIIQNVVNQIKF
ncbi:MAG: hypothetical protein AAGA77_07995 [Bacteroidota bacterium]